MIIKNKDLDAAKVLWGKGNLELNLGAESPESLMEYYYIPIMFKFPDVSNMLDRSEQYELVFETFYGAEILMIMDIANKMKIP